jgi:hypothetical protein
MECRHRKSRGLTSHHAVSDKLGTEGAAIYHKERLDGAMQAAEPVETPGQAWEGFMRDWRARQQSVFPEMWAAAGIDEILSALHEQIVVGSLA